MPRIASKRKSTGVSARGARGVSKAKVNGPPKRWQPMPLEVQPSIVERVQQEMGDTWRKDIHLLEKFFPLGKTADPRYERARGALFNEKLGRWKGISAVPNPPSRIYTPLVSLLNGILSYYGIDRKHRLFFNTHSRRNTSKIVEPGIVLAGVGSEFANSGAPWPIPMNNLGISAFEVNLDARSLPAARNRLAVCTQRIMQHQTNRRYAFGVVITTFSFTVYLFDHSGVVASSPCNYHTHPDQFCAVISGLASEKDQIGFDNSIFSDGRRATILTHEPGDDDSEKITEYVIKEGLFKFPTLVGRGTVCWVTSRKNDESLYVIKDAWIAPSELAGRESEADLIRHVQSCGVVAGVVQIHHFEEVRRSADASDLDTVLRNRGIKDISPTDLNVERIHTRMVMKPYGKTLDQFSTRKELLLAFYDAVLAHRQLHDVAGILHRDISIANILINPEGAEGNRGVLIDFDHSIRVGDTSPYSKKPKIVIAGTWRFMSRAVLKGQSHTYLDDLESFYYVLCWVLCFFESAGVPKSKPLQAEELSFWDRYDSDQLKGGHIVCAFDIPISHWFGPLHDLAADLHDFFQSRIFYPHMHTTIDPAKDYQEFIACIQLCITELEQEDRS